MKRFICIFFVLTIVFSVSAFATSSSSDTSLPPIEFNNGDYIQGKGFVYDQFSLAEFNRCVDYAKTQIPNFESYKYFVLHSTANSNEYVLQCSSSEFLLNTSSSYSRPAFYPSESQILFSVFFDLNLNPLRTYNKSTFSNLMSFNLEYGNFKFFSNHDIYSSSTFPHFTVTFHQLFSKYFFGGELVFQQPPRSILELAAEGITVETILGTIPVVALLIGLVCFLGFRKGWIFLQSQLKGL